MICIEWCDEESFKLLQLLGSTNRFHRSLFSGQNFISLDKKKKEKLLNASSRCEIGESEDAKIGVRFPNEFVSFLIFLWIFYFVPREESFRALFNPSHCARGSGLGTKIGNVVTDAKKCVIFTTGKRAFSKKRSNLFVGISKSGAYKPTCLLQAEEVQYKYNQWFK